MQRGFLIKLLNLVAKSESNTAFPGGKYALAASLLLFFVSLFFFFSVPISDPDFWWHIATGKWMFQEQSLPLADPFSFVTPPGNESLRTDFILKQYWLSQIIFYGVYETMGFIGIVILRSLLFTALFFILYRLMYRSGTSHIIALLITYSAVMAIANEIQYIGDRPQMWTSFFSVVIIVLLDAMNRGKRWASVVLPFIMLLWSNMHGGFILGMVIIGIYLVVGIADKLWPARFIISSIIALLLSGCNPGGYKALAAFAPFLTGSGINDMYRESISEGQSIFRHARLTAIPRMLPYLTSLCILSIISFFPLISRWKTLRKEKIILYVSSCIMGFVAIRFIFFYVIVAAWITATNLGSIAALFRDKHPGFQRIAVMKAVTVVTLLMVFAASGRLFAASIENSALLTGQMYEDRLEGTVGFIKDKHIRGRIFNDHNDGGYFIWRLYPDVKVFIDGRSLSLALFDEFRTTIDNPYASASQSGPDRFLPYYKNIFNRYNISIVAIPACDVISGTLIPLSVALLQDEEWRVVYADFAEVIFLKRTEDNLQIIADNPVPRTVVYDLIISVAFAASQSPHARMMPNWQYAMAYAYNGKGDKATALHYLTEYLKAAPGDRQALVIKEQLEYEIRSKQ